jgi:hypothetical protein
MAELEPDTTVEPPSEAIHLPEPSYMPPVLAAGVTISLVGILTWFPVIIIGVIIVLVTIVRWVRSARADFNDLPLEHH